MAATMATEGELTLPSTTSIPMVVATHSALSATPSEEVESLQDLLEDFKKDYENLVKSTLDPNDYVSTTSVVPDTKDYDDPLRVLLNSSQVAVWIILVLLVLFMTGKSVILNILKRYIYIYNRNCTILDKFTRVSGKQICRVLAPES